MQDNWVDTLLGSQESQQPPKAAAPEPPAPPESPQPPEPPAKPKRKWLLPVIAAGVVVLLLAVVVLLLLPGKPEDPAQSCQLEGDICADGRLCFPLPDGTCITLQEADVLKAVMTADRKRIVVWKTDGSVYVTDAEQQQVHSLSGPNTIPLWPYLHNDGMVYKTEDGNWFRVRFADMTSVCLGQCKTYPVVAAGSTVTLYGSGQAVYALLADGDQPLQIGTYVHDFDPVAISDDGRLAVWVETQGTTQTLFLYDGRKQHQLHQATAERTIYSSASVEVTFSADQKMAVIRCPATYRMWLKNPKADPIEVTFGEDLRTYDTPVYTNAGPLQEADSQAVSSLYIATRATKGAQVYWMNVTGACQILLHRVYDYTILDGQLFYRSTDYKLYRGALSDGAVRDVTQIAEDVDIFRVSGDGQFVYYICDGEDTGALFCYRVDADQSHAIAQGAAAWGAALRPSPDGSTVLFFRETCYTNWGAQLGTLMKWSWSSKECTLLARDVVVSSVTSGWEYPVLLPDSLSYLQYDATASTKQQLGNRMYFDGKQHLLVTDKVRLGLPFGSLGPGLLS